MWAGRPLFLTGSRKEAGRILNDTVRFPLKVKPRMAFLMPLSVRLYMIQTEECVAGAALDKKEGTEQNVNAAQLHLSPGRRNSC